MMMQMETNERNKLQGSYRILQDPQGDLVMIIEAREEEPDCPLFIYDGHDTALLCRTLASSLKLNNIADEARELLLAADEIFIAEIKGADIVRDYYASVKIVPNVTDLIAL